MVTKTEFKELKEKYWNKEHANKAIIITNDFPNRLLIIVPYSYWSTSDIRHQILELSKSGTKYYVYYKEMAIPATNAAVTAELYQIGESEPISSYTYCLDAFFESRKTNSAMGTLVVALAKLGQSFRAFNAK